MLQLEASYNVRGQMKYTTNDLMVQSIRTESKASCKMESSDCLVILTISVLKSATKMHDYSVLSTLLQSQPHLVMGLLDLTS